MTRPASGSRTATTSTATPGANSGTGRGARLAVVGDWTVATVVEVHPQSPHGRSIVLDVPAWPGNLAGQHLDVRLTAPDGYQASRSYSIASSGPAMRIELGVDRLPDGEVSPYLVDDVRP